MSQGSNPLVDLSFAIPFDRILPSHVEPAISALIAGARENLEAIEAVQGARTYENTIDALDRATERLEVAMTVVAHLESVASTRELRAAHNAVRPEVTAFYAGIPMRPKLWDALSAYAGTEDARALTGARKRYLQKTLDDFKRHGAKLDPEGKKKLEALSRELAELTTRFAQNVLDSTAEWELVVETLDELAGLPPSAIDQARDSAEKKGKTGWRLTLQAPSYIPLVTYADDARLREKAYRAYNSRATIGAFDNAPIMERILALRLEQATLLGYGNFADLVLEDRMAKSGDRARDFVSDLTKRSVGAFERESLELLSFRKNLEGAGAPPLAPWDVAYYAEKQRKALYDFDEEELRAYFRLDAVIDGLFETVRRLYGVRVVENAALKTWHPDVRAYDMTDEDGTFLASFFADFFPREEKRGGAWMNAFITGRSDGRAATPHLGLISANVTPPIGNKPSLLTHQEVTTLFHEFGHLMHHCLSRVEVRSLAGTNVAWDFVELPSQIMENWCWERAALDTFARHIDSAETISEALFAKMSRARSYREATAMMRQLGFGAVDLALHLDYHRQAERDVLAYSRRILQPYAPAPLEADYGMIASFTHLFASSVGYAAGYYSYKWAEVLDADAFTRFRGAGVFSREVGDDFRRKILERGDSEDPMDLYKGFMGREPSLDALLERAGLR